MNTTHLDQFTQAYIECALWSSTDNADDSGGEPLDRNYSASDISEETREQMIADCAKFQRENHCDILLCTKDDAQAGHDFWLSRNGHGAGFFDAYKGEPYPDDVAARLQDIAHAFAPFDLYIGDDGRVHGSPLTAVTPVESEAAK
jgi:hypothetical protein